MIWLLYCAGVATAITVDCSVTYSASPSRDELSTCSARQAAVGVETRDSVLCSQCSFVVLTTAVAC